VHNLSVPLAVIIILAVLASFPARAHSTEQSQPRPSPGSGHTEAAKPAQADERPSKQQKNVQPPVYRPPRRGAPLVRVGGGTRGQGDIQPAVYVLVPEHTGLTSHAQPELFWYSSGPTTARLEFALIDDHSIDPILETSLQPTRSAGIQRISLAEYGIELSPGLEYQWSVAFIPEPEQRSRDLVASGRIEYVPPTPALAGEIEEAAQQDLAYLYAREGLWYDALAALSAQIEAAPTDTKLREFRAALLEQVGLRDVAAAEKTQTR
jgi:hypothetical protein